MRTEDLLAMTAHDCLAHLGSSPSGLSTAEAALRQRQYGMNEIAEARRYRGLIAFLGHLKNPLVIILVIAAIVSAFVGEIVEAAIILVIVVLGQVLCRAVVNEPVCEIRRHLSGCYCIILNH